MNETIIVSGGMEDFPLAEQWGHDYRPHARVPWLSNALWWLLGKLGCIRPHMGTVHRWRFQRHVKEPRVLEAIHKAVNIEAVWRRPDEFAVVMGIEDYMTLMGQERDSLPVSNFMIAARPFGYRGEIFGIPVHVVNTLSGIAAIPRVMIEKTT